MKKEDRGVGAVGEHTFRVTRARAAACLSSVGSKVSKDQGQTQPLRRTTKRAALDEGDSNTTVTAGVQNKRRAVLKDVTNIFCDNSYKNCITAAKIQKKNIKQAKRNLVDVSKGASSATVGIQQVPAHSQARKCNDTGVAQIRADTVQCVGNVDKNKRAERDSDINTTQIGKRVVSQLQGLSKKGESSLHEKLMITSKSDYSNIDHNQKDPQMCSLYASEIYSNLRAAELICRPHSDSMETVQKDVTQSMRGVLVDWLVEVSEEYKLVADTLYLTVHLIDLFLSQHYIERHKLQLLGVSCMLIASKYEETLAPSAEDFCLITDGTYTKSEVLKMERQVLNHLKFQLSAPTAKKFLRRFLRAAQASHQKSGPELEYLANYLAELTLINYNFLTFLPSTIAASAVFLAIWTLDQSSHPWNGTLEHYTSYKPLDLKNAVLALYGLQTSDPKCPLNAIHAKYKQEKFKCVASLPSPELPETLF